VTRAAVLSTVLLVVTACRSAPDTPRGTAERFVDEHYVRIDLEAAKAYCTGLALQKLEEEKRLTEGQVIDTSTRMPTVRYKVISEKQSEVDATYVFAATIQVEGAGSLSRRWIVTVRRTDVGWKVANFKEFD
jgi:hypothetical protein